MPTPNLIPSQTGFLALPSGRPPDAARWTVRTPAGLILADWRERHAWRVAVEGARCRVAVPDYAPPGQGYRLCLGAGTDALELPFDVA